MSAWKKKKNECSGKPQTQSWEFYTHTFFFFVVVWLCFLNPLPGRSARPSMPTGFLSCDIYFFSLPSLLFFSFLFFHEAQQLCRYRWAESSTPRCNNTIYFHINRLTNVSSLANHVSMATFSVAGRRRFLPVMRLRSVCVGGEWNGQLTV